MNSFLRTKTSFLTSSFDPVNCARLLPRITFYYGLIYEHGNFNVATHDILHEIFGTAAAGYFHHMAKCLRCKKLVDKNGRDIYLPGLSNDGECDCDPKDLEWVENINIPIYMFCGEIPHTFRHLLVQICADGGVGGRRPQIF